MPRRGPDAILLLSCRWVSFSLNSSLLVPDEIVDFLNSLSVSFRLTGGGWAGLVKRASFGVEGAAAGVAGAEGGGRLREPDKLAMGLLVLGKYESILVKYVCESGLKI